MIRRRRRASLSFTGFGFPPDVVLLALRWHVRYGLFLGLLAAEGREEFGDVNHHGGAVGHLDGDVTELARFPRPRHHVDALDAHDPPVAPLLDQ